MPIVGTGTEMFDDRIAADVVVFQIGFGLVAQTVVEEVVLPGNSVLFGMVSFPLADDA